MSQQPIANVAQKRIQKIFRSNPDCTMQNIEAAFTTFTPPHELSAISAATAKRERKKNERIARRHQ